MITVVFIGCTEEKEFVSDDRLLGSWKNKFIETEILIFFPDGTWNTMDSKGTWTIDDGKLFISKETTSGDTYYRYDYTVINGNTLKFLQNGDVFKEYTKQ